MSRHSKISLKTYKVEGRMLCKSNGKEFFVENHHFYVIFDHLYDKAREKP